MRPRVSPSLKDDTVYGANLVNYYQLVFSDPIPLPMCARRQKSSPILLKTGPRLELLGRTRIDRFLRSKAPMPMMPRSLAGRFHSDLKKLVRKVYGPMGREGFSKRKGNPHKNSVSLGLRLNVGVNVSTISHHFRNPSTQFPTLFGNRWNSPYAWN